LHIRVQVQAGFELKNRNKIRCVDQRLVFRAFRVAQRPLISQLSQRIDPLLNWPLDLEIDDSTCRLSIEATAQGRQNPIQATCSTHVDTLARTGAAKAWPADHPGTRRQRRITAPCLRLSQFAHRKTRPQKDRGILLIMNMDFEADYISHGAFACGRKETTHRMLWWRCFNENV
jgi:hypothetical protein